MKKIVMTMMLFISIAVQGQELMSVIDIKPQDTIAYGYVYNDTAYQRVFVFWNKCQPELDDYLTIVKRDHLASNDTITRLLYQNKSATGDGTERFIIYSKLRPEPIVLLWTDLSPTLQASVAVFGNKYYTNFKMGFYYEN